MILAPSVLSLDYANFNESVDILNKNCSWLHFDVMDGHFVPNISFGPDILKSFRKSTSLLLDVHLMISDPKFYIDSFLKAGADSITFHVEALNNDVEACKELIDYIHSKYIKAGISIKPNTPVSVIEPLLEYVDLVLVMSVEPGFGGQKFMEDSIDKVKELKTLKEENNLKYLIEIDGGINEHNVHQVVENGVEVVVAGSAVFKGNVKDNIDRLMNCDH